MTPINKILAGVLALQVVLAAITWIPRGGDASEPVQFVSSDTDSITRITIVGRTSPEEEAEPDQVTLTRSDGGWAIEDLGGYPADTTKVDELFENLTALVGRSPTGTTPASHYPLQVADDAFTRKVTLMAGDEEQTLYLGAASGSGMHVREASNDEVFTTRGVSAWSIADQNRRYYDTKYLEHGADDIDSFRVRNAQGDHTFIRVDGEWQIEGTEGSAGLEISEVASLVRTLMNVRIHEPVSKEIEPQHGLDGRVRVEWSVTENETTTPHGYTVGAEASDGKRYVQADGNEWVIEVLNSTVTRAIETDFAFLGESSDGE